ncbi:FAD-dependent oxidoreductase [Heliorestis convoluta]|uniref:FAD-dependent oxidoreductase n=1 Tax=Heliorestis convoluta TaxID=356322 RepID=A0A5Q2N663_9FIRM|nr:FAD-dependent oxidoreductase [Heliorestis convoluta]QGG47750.1 FAD-dependent oxidoreductase [Heliorestis convoluta]
MAKVVIIGGGWAGAGAAVTAAKAGADVVLLERTDMLLGTGLVGGIMRNNGRFTATEEAIALGAPELFQAVDDTARHKNIEFPGHKHATLYDVAKIEPAVRQCLEQLAVNVRFESLVNGVKVENNRITAVVLKSGEEITGDVFIETTGTAGPMGNCAKYGNGCAMCILRCPTFGGRVSIAAKAGVQEIVGKKGDGSIGAMSGSCKLHKESLAPSIVEELDKTGVAIVPIPAKLQKGDSLGVKACQQYALKEFAENIILLDTGHAKLMSPYYALDKLRQIPGFEDARFEDPYSGGIGNSVRYLALSPRDNTLKVEGIENLFCGGEKAGLLVGHTEAIVTGSLAGHNAVRQAKGKELVELPTNLAIGDAIAHVNEQMKTEEGLGKKYTFSGSVYFERMKAEGIYCTDIAKIQEKVDQAGLTGVFAKKI